MKYVKCPRCGTENVANRILCVKCAESLATAPIYERLDVADLFSGIRPPQAATASGGVSLTTDVVEKARLWEDHLQKRRTSRLKTGANCFYWIAAVSAINTVIFWSSQPIRFLDSLGVAQLINLFARGLMQQLTKLAVIPEVAAIALNLLIALGLVALGIYAHKANKVVFIAGFALYTLDMLIVARNLDLLSVAFHILMLYGLYLGLRASLEAL